MDPELTPPSIFQTRWTLIDQARNSDSGTAESKRAIQEVISRYQPAILGAIRRNGVNRTDSEDLCQEFLVRTFLSKTLPRADRSKGRFRTFLVHSLRYFLVSHRRAEMAEKRGAGRVKMIEDLAIGEETGALVFEEARAEHEFEMDFAHCIHARVLEELRHDYESRGKELTFRALSPHILDRESNLESQRCDDLEISGEAARQALSRLRQRYRQAFLAKVEEFIDPGDDLRVEAKELMKLVLARSRKS